jgi:toluene monooxygenase system ferredoxin subunit
MALKPAMRQEELWIGEMAGVTIDGKAVLLTNVEGRVCAYEDRCLHRGLPLSQGRLIDGRLVCRAHEWTYDACTGRGVNPANISLRRYRVELADDDILVDVDAA